MAKSIQLDIDSANIKRIVPLRLANAGLINIAKELKLTRHYVEKMVNSEEFKAALRETSEEMTSQAVSSWKAAISNLIPKSVEVLKAKLEEGDLDAVKLVFRSLGVENQEPTQQSGNVTVVLPDYRNEKYVTSDVEITND